MRSLAATDTARSASANAARGTRTSFSLCCGMTCEYGGNCASTSRTANVIPPAWKNALDPLCVICSCGFAAPFLGLARRVSSRQATKLLDRLERDQHRRRRLTPADLDLHLRQPMPVGRHHANDVAVPLEQRGVQVRAGLVARDREVRLVDELAQHVDVEGERGRALGRAGQGREVVARHAAQRVATRGARGLDGRAGVVLRRRGESGRRASSGCARADPSTGTATLPPLLTSTVTRPTSARYRSVAATRSALGPSTASSTFESTGIVLLRSATPCMRVTSFSRSLLATVSSIQLRSLFFASLDEICSSVDRAWGGRGET